MPGMVDSHIHAPQYAYTGTHLDLPLLEWLNQYTFPIESSFRDTDFAKKVYRKVVVRLNVCKNIHKLTNRRKIEKGYSILALI